MVQQRAVLTRTRVLTAAAEIFARTGFSAASLNDVTAAAHVTKGALYFHFAGKDALAAAIVAEHSEQWPPLIAAIRESASTPFVAVVALTYELGARLADDPVSRAGLRLCMERDLIDAEIPVAFAAWTGEVTELLSEARLLGLLRAGLTPAAAAETLIAAFFGVRQLADNEDFETRLDDLWKMLLPGLATEPDWSGIQRAARRTRSSL